VKFTMPHPTRWLHDEALPFWSRQASDHEFGGFFERLSPTGEPYPSDPKSTLVQSRMLFTYAHAAYFEGGTEVRAGIDLAFSFLTHRLFDPMSGGFMRAVGSNGDPQVPGANPIKDTYDHSFVLLGLAALYRVRPTAEVMSWVETTWTYLQDHLLDPRTGGYHEDSRAYARAETYPMPRRQNPHMHLFEALLAVFEATGQHVWMEHAERILDVFRRYLFDRQTGSLREFLGRDLEDLPGPAGLVREPGHHFEWAWLLYRYAALSGDVSVRDHAAALYSFGTRHGVQRSGTFAGAAYDEIGPDGTPIKKSMLLWPQTEAVKAHLARFEDTGDRRCLQDAVLAARLIFENFISGNRPLWRNQIDELGRTLQPDAPTRLLYHLIMFITEGERLSAWADLS
jgi:mannose/cellobiose epimerase-like protein (N-acyl-D-glucosamine 2-epimerase family)